ncbi:serine/threonine-protein kinase [Nocardia pseudovaccinii]|uniref:serine/threonine-protein kinase n=1 Tax=Nocardia pseudovaccinii TaxID=189540 RepID=UPI0009FDEA0D|nr:serine/threonine-protein kinase [Nocardia pseudovaccinii]
MTSDTGRLRAVLPAYDIGAQVGRGGCGVVLAGTHRRLGRPVAIKQIPPQFAHDEQVRRRFVAEARLLAAIDHPHVVRVFDYIEADELCLLVMEYLPGGTVGSRFATEGFDAATAVAVGLACAAGLEAAHRHKILHRDVKPSNLMFGTGGAIKLTDFGIAKIVGGDETLVTRTGEIVGTPSYIAPEQARGQQLSAATDVYALAAMLYQLLSGVLPFPPHEDHLATLFAHAFGHPIPLIEVAPGVPEPIADVVMRGLATDPADRFDTAELFGIALAELAALCWGGDWLTPVGIPVIGADTIVAAATGSSRAAGRSGIQTPRARGGHGQAAVTQRTDMPPAGFGPRTPVTADPTLPATDARPGVIPPVPPASSAPTEISRTPRPDGTDSVAGGPISPVPPVHGGITSGSEQSGAATPGAQTTSEPPGVDLSWSSAPEPPGARRPALEADTPGAHASGGATPTPRPISGSPVREPPVSGWPAAEPRGLGRGGAPSRMPGDVPSVRPTNGAGQGSSEYGESARPMPSSGKSMPGPSGSAPLRPPMVRVRPVHELQDNGVRLADVDRRDLVPIRDVVSFASPWPLFLVGALLAAGACAVALLGVGAPTAGGDLVHGTVTLAGIDVTGPNPIEVDLSKPIPLQVNGIDVDSAVLTVEVFGVRLGGDPVPLQPGGVADLPDPVNSRVLAGNLDGELTLLRSGTEIATQRIEFRTVQNPTRTAAAAVIVVLVLFAVAYLESNTRTLRRGHGGLANIIGLSVSSAILSAAVAGGAWILRDTSPTSTTLAVAAVLGAAAGVAAALGARRIGKRRRFLRRARRDNR